MFNNKRQPYKSCHCKGCKASMRRCSGTKVKRFWKRDAHVKFRRKWKVNSDHNMNYISGDRMS